MVYKVTDAVKKRGFGALVLGAAVAAASSVTAAPAAAGTAPACIHRFASNKYHEVGIVNECGRLMGVKVVINWGRDSPCFVLFPQSIQKFRWRFGTYGKTVTCPVQV